MLLPLKLPAGMFRNGTKYQAKGRWYEGSLVRFFEGTIRPIGGWQKLQTVDTTPTDVVVTGTARGSIAWRGDDGGAWYAAGTTQGLFAFSSGVLADITPAGYVDGNVDSSVADGGYGDGPYGFYQYGITDATRGVPVEAATWALDTFGDFLVGVQTPADGKLYVWDRVPANPAAAASGAPINNSGVVVTPERFIFVLGAGGNVRMVQWASQETYDDWTPTDTNSAGDQELQTDGRIMCGLRGKSETLIWTDTDLHAAKYIGSPFYYAFEKVGSKCGVISRHAAAVVDSTAFWMGTHGFFLYNGYVQSLPCEIADQIFDDLNYTQAAKIHATTIAEYGEVWWFYPSANATEVDSYVVYNYRENQWTFGKLARTTATDAGAFDTPFWVTPGGQVLKHETGISRTDLDGTTVLRPYLESGPVELGDGQRIYMATQLVPDEKTQGQTQAYLYFAFYPNAPEQEGGPYSLANPTDVRVTGRQVRVRIEEVVASDWRVGEFRLQAKLGGER